MQRKFNDSPTTKQVIEQSNNLGGCAMVLYMQSVIEGGGAMVSNKLFTPAAGSGLRCWRERRPVRGGSRLSETAYRGWIKRLIFFHGKRHPAGAGMVGRAVFPSAGAGR